MAEETKRGRGRPQGTGGNKRPDRTEACSTHMEPGENGKFVEANLWLLELEPIDSNDPEQVNQRITEYFNKCVEHDMKPAVSGLAMAIGVDRRTLLNWVNGVYREKTHLPVIKRAYEFLTLMLEEYMEHGKINPVAGIFLMKNNHGYKDQQEVAVIQEDKLGDQIPDEELQNRYMDECSD